MTEKKTLPEREKELQSLLATSSGREELRRLESPYREASGNLRGCEHIDHHVYPCPREATGADSPLIAR